MTVPGSLLRVNIVSNFVPASGSRYIDYVDESWTSLIPGWLRSRCRDSSADTTVTRALETVTRALETEARTKTRCGYASAQQQRSTSRSVTTLHIRKRTTDAYTTEGIASLRSTCRPAGETAATHRFPAAPSSANSVGSRPKEAQLQGNGGMGAWSNR